MTIGLVLFVFLLVLVVQPDSPRTAASPRPRRRFRIAFALLGALVLGQSADRRRRFTPAAVRAVAPHVAQQAPDAGVDAAAPCGPPEHSETMLAADPKVLAGEPVMAEGCGPEADPMVAQCHIGRL